MPRITATCFVCGKRGANKQVLKYLWVHDGKCNPKTKCCICFRTLTKNDIEIEERSVAISSKLIRHSRCAPITSNWCKSIWSQDSFITKEGLLKEEVV